MRRRRKKYDLYIAIALLVFVLGYFLFNFYFSEERGVKAYSSAIEVYKQSDFEKAYKLFGKVPKTSGLKNSARFRQARCATNLDNKDDAVRKYRKIVHSRSKSAIVPISEYNMAVLYYEMKDKRAAKHFRHIIKKYPTSDYAIASEYYLGLIEVNNLPKSEKRRIKSLQKALDHFKIYVEKSPDGRFARQTVNAFIKLNVKPNNYENLLVAKVYYHAGEFEKAEKYLNKTTLSESWVDFAKNYYKLGNKDKTRYYTEAGLKDYSQSVKEEDIFEAVDDYILTFDSRKDGIQNLVSKNYNGKGADYIGFLNCNEVVALKDRDACFNNLYTKYPDGRFSAEALYNFFISKYIQKKYNEAQRLGFLHLKKFPNVKSSPAVMYFMGKTAGKLKHYESASNYFKRVISLHPDSYYAYRAYCNLHKNEGVTPFTSMLPKPVVFPYKKSMDNNLVVKLALLKDYDLVEELCKKDKFIQSWVAYQKGNYTISVILARNAMEELEAKPSFEDLRWRLVYPAHYYKEVDRYKRVNNPLIIESIIKEESHFNPYAASSVGAKGLMQLMPSTYAEISKNYGIVSDIFNPDNNIKAGSAYYENLKKVLGNKDLYAITAYNGGIGSINSWFSKLIYSDTDEFVEQIPYPETKNYVKKVLRTYWMYGNLY